MLSKNISTIGVLILFIISNTFAALTDNYPPQVKLSITVHLENIGDTYGKDSQWVGTKGQSRRLEAFSITPLWPSDLFCQTPRILYMAHLQNIGDVAFVNQGQFVGTKGQSRRLQGFAIKLVGPVSQIYEIRYRAHIQDIGDTTEFKDGQFCGTRGLSRRVEAIYVRMIKKNTYILPAKHLCIQNCGDGVRTYGEICDNANSLGCSINCLPDPGFTCYGPVGSTSICLKDSICGNSIVDPGQLCDNGNNLGCSNKCNIDEGYSCTRQIGKASSCSFCGNGIVEYGEQCDNKNQLGCSANCKIDKGFNCRGFASSICHRKSPICGNGLVQIGQMCDDGNLNLYDGCNNFCRTQDGFSCKGGFSEKSNCIKNNDPYSTCGNQIFQPYPSLIGFIQQCDNGNQEGCQGCLIKQGWLCLSSVGEKSVCFKIKGNPCGNGILQYRQICDDGNVENSDGCNNRCQVQFGWICIPGSKCKKIQRQQPPLKNKGICGNGRVEYGEQCDDGFPLLNGDGCSKQCKIEEGWICSTSNQSSNCRRY